MIIKNPLLIEPLFYNDGQYYLPLTASQRDAKQQIEKKIQNNQYQVTFIVCLCGAGKESQVLLSSKDRYGLAQSIVFCQRCSMVYNAAPFNEESCVKFYDEDYRNLYNPGFIVQKMAFEKQYQRGQEIYRMVKGLLSEKSIRVLDIGCDGGGYLKPFKEHGHQVMGIDLDSRNFSYGASHGINTLKKCSIKELVVEKTELFGMIIMSHVLEHVSDPVEHLRMIYQLLDQDGLFYVEVPNFDPYDKTDFLAELQNAHVWYFDEFTMTELLKSTGFRILKVTKPFHIGFLVQKSEPVVKSSYLQGPGVDKSERKLRAFFTANQRQKIKNLYRMFFYYPLKLKRAIFKSTNR